MTGMYAALHLLVDSICALAMFGNFMRGENEQFCFLLYNFCAFALQMPFGVLQDMLNLWYKDKKQEFSLCFALIGVTLTILGVITHPILLGIGNALFHVGGGVGTIQEDEAKGWNGKGLGVFVAPGAFGLYLGTVAAKDGFWREGFVAAVCLVIVLAIMAGVLHRRVEYTSEILNKNKGSMESRQSGALVLSVCCFLVVILRSYIGMAVSFSWKQAPVLGLISVLAVVCGKAAGGFLMDRLGYGKMACLTLGIAALGYLGSELALLGILALFAFNMTMPMTLYLLIKALPQLPGFSFGLLTFGMFLGFLPVYFGWQTDWSGQLTGVFGSIISMMILLLGIWQGGKHESVSA